MRKASSMVASRPARCRRRLRLNRTVSTSPARAVALYHFPTHSIARRLNAQLRPPIPTSAVAACEQAFSRELLLPLSGDTVLAAVPWLRPPAKARQ